KLPNRCDAATNANVSTICCGLCLLQSRVNAFSDKVKVSASGHLQRGASVMRQDKHGHVVRRLVAPPAFPTLVRPRPANWAKHVAAENPRANSGKALLGNLVIDAGFSVFLAMHHSPNTSMEKPFHQLRTVDA